MAEVESQSGSQSGLPRAVGPDDRSPVSVVGAGARPVPAAGSGGGGRDSFAVDELAIVMSHFDIGAIELIQEFPRGSRKAPKLLITAEQGRFLLKRRAKGKDDPYKVAFCHALQLHLAQRQFPLPHLIGTKRDNNSMLQLKGGVYELFEYIPGQNYPQTIEATVDSGRVLALFHKLLKDFESPWQAPTGSYHAASSVEKGLGMILAALGGDGDTAQGDLRALTADLTSKYRTAADAVNRLGLPNWPPQIAHADWHPGNMLFRDNHVVAVIDYDSARMLPRVIDAANGALQFSILGGDENVARWPDHPDEVRFKRFCRGYDTVDLLSRAELEAFPHLMIEALIAEAVLPIATTGTFGRLEGLAFLKMVQRKAGFLAANAGKLVALVAS